MESQLQSLQEFIQTEIPIAHAMGASLARFDADGLVLRAPLDKNRNYLGTGFAGSLASLATLAGWALTHLAVEGMGMHPEVIVSATRLEYLRPVGVDIEVLARMPGSAAAEKLRKSLARKRIGRWDVAAEIHAAGEMAVNFTGTYVVTVGREA